MAVAVAAVIAAVVFVLGGVVADTFRQGQCALGPTNQAQTVDC